MAKAIADYVKENPAKAAMLAGLHILNPFATPMILISDAIQKKVSTIQNRTEKVINAQREAAVAIIKAGKENGVSKIRVTLNQKAGIDIGGSLEGYSLKFDVGSDDSMTIEVEYA
jgi:hypothetical protein